MRLTGTSGTVLFAMRGEVDVCAIEAAWGGCDLEAPRYRVPDTLTAEERVTILTAISKAALRSARIWDTARRAGAIVGTVDVMPGNVAVAHSARLAQAVAAKILGFVQTQVGYKDDPEGEWYQGPLYTLAHGGDCEDLTVLLVALYTSVGLRARIVWLDQPQARLNHVTAQVLLEGSWQWTEPSIAGARLGENPYDAVARVGQAQNLGVRDRSSTAA